MEDNDASLYVVCEKFDKMNVEFTDKKLTKNLLAIFTNESFAKSYADDLTFKWFCTYVFIYSWKFITEKNLNLLNDFLDKNPKIGFSFSSSKFRVHYGESFVLDSFDKGSVIRLLSETDSLPFFVCSVKIIA